MLKQHNGLVVFKAYGEEDSGTQEPGAQVPITETPEFQETLKAEIAKALAAETGGLKSKNSELKSERDKFKAQADAFVAQAQELEDQEALKSGKMDWQALMDKRMNANNQTWQERLQAEQSEKDELRKEIDVEKGKLKQFQIKQLVGNAALQNQFLAPTAVKDVLKLAPDIWDLADSGELVARDQHGNVILGKTGRALTPKEWISSLEEEYPHYFPELKGSGAKQGSGGNAQTMTRQEWQQKLMLGTAQEQSDLFTKRSKGEIVVS